MYQSPYFIKKFISTNRSRVKDPHFFSQKTAKNAYFWKSWLLGPKIPPRGASLTWNIVLYAGYLYQPFWTIKIQPSRQQGPGKVKIWPRMPQNDKRGPRGHRIKQNKCDHCHWNVTAFAPLGSLPTPLHPSTGIANLICNAHIWALHVNITTWTYCSNWYFSHFILEIHSTFRNELFLKTLFSPCAAFILIALGKTVG